jgi:hypothetical protein
MIVITARQRKSLEQIVRLLVQAEQILAVSDL